MPYFSLYWLQHYNDLPENDWPHGQLQPGDFDYDWMREKGLRAAGIDDDGHNIWVDPRGIAYYDTDLKRIQGGSQDTDNDYTPADEVTGTSPNNDDNGGFSPIDNPLGSQSVTQPVSAPVGYQVPAMSIPAFRPPGNVPVAGGNITPSPFGSGLPGNANIFFNVFSGLPGLQNSGLPVHPLVLQSVNMAANPVLQGTGIVANGNLVLSVGGGATNNAASVFNGSQQSNSQRRDSGNDDEIDNDQVPVYHGKGTRVFLFMDQHYDKPRYVHNDGKRDVFICFRNTKLNNVIKILQANSGKNEIFYKDNLEEYGAYYLLDAYEDFAWQFTDIYTAKMDGSYEIYSSTDNKLLRTNNKLNGKKWTPSAEVVQRLAKTGTVLIPKGIEIHVDDPYNYNRNPPIGKPNLSESDPNPLYKQNAPPSGVWTKGCIHIHPYGAKRTDITDRERDEYSWIEKGKSVSEKADIGPSGADSNTLFGESKFNDNSKTIRWIIVDRKRIYLYTSARLMQISRINPDNRFS